MKRTLRLRKEMLAELSDRDLEALAGAAASLPVGCIAIKTQPLYTCLFKCTEA